MRNNTTEEDSPMYCAVSRELRTRNWHVKKLAGKMGLTNQRLIDIIRGNLELSDDMATQLKRIFGRTAGEWISNHKRWTGCKGVNCSHKERDL